MIGAAVTFGFHFISLSLLILLASLKRVCLRRNDDVGGASKGVLILVYIHLMLILIWQRITNMCAHCTHFPHTNAALLLMRMNRFYFSFFFNWQQIERKSVQRNVTQNRRLMGSEHSMKRKRNKQRNAVGNKNSHRQFTPKFA